MQSYTFANDPVVLGQTFERFCAFSGSRTYHAEMFRANTIYAVSSRMIATRARLLLLRIDVRELKFYKLE